MPFRYKSVAVEQTGEWLWRTTRPVVYSPIDWPTRYKGNFVDIPAGFVSDFGSVPKFLWSIFPRDGLYVAATVVHDYLIDERLPKGQITSRRVDEVFRLAMQELGVSFPRRWFAWAGVRWGALFNKKRRAGSLGTFPGVFLISLLALPIVLPAVAVLPSLFLFWLIEKVSR